MSVSTDVSPDDVAGAEGGLDDETRTERCMRALALRNAGATYPQIAERMECSPAQARRNVTAALKLVMSEPAEDMVARQRAILLDLHRAHYAHALNRDPEAVRVVFDCLKHEANLFGLYAPARVNVGVTDTEFAEQAVALVASLGLTPSRELEVSRQAEAPNRRTAEQPLEAEVVDPIEEDDSWSNV